MGGREWRAAAFLKSTPPALRGTSGREIMTLLYGPGQVFHAWVTKGPKWHCTYARRGNWRLFDCWRRGGRKSAAARTDAFGGNPPLSARGFSLWRHFGRWAPRRLEASRAETWRWGRGSGALSKTRDWGCAPDPAVSDLRSPLPIPDLHVQPVT